MSNIISVPDAAQPTNGHQKVIIVLNTMLKLLNFEIYSLIFRSELLWSNASSRNVSDIAIDFFALKYVYVLIF